jgi:hypothetical protein
LIAAPEQTVEEERAALFWKNAKRAVALGTVIYPSQALADYLVFHDKNWLASAAIRLVATLLALLAFLTAAYVDWGKRHRGALITSMFFIVYTGFQAVVYLQNAYGSEYGDALDLFFAVYCLLLPVPTRYAISVGVAMAAMSLGGEAFLKHRIPSTSACPSGTTPSLCRFSGSVGSPSTNSGTPNTTLAPHSKQPFAIFK